MGSVSTEQADEMRLLKAHQTAWERAWRRLRSSVVATLRPSLFADRELNGHRQDFLTLDGHHEILLRRAVTSTCLPQRCCS